MCYAALELGASDFLLQPIDPREFTRRIGNVLCVGSRTARNGKLLQREAQAARLHARRLDMIWRAGAASVDDDTFLRNLIDDASRGLVEGRHFAGAIARLDGDEFVIDFANEVPDGTGYVTVGHRFPTANHREAIDANTIEGVQDIPPERRARANWRSTVFAPFQVGPTRYFLAFYSLEPMPGPFTAFDTSFIETIASLCSSRLQQRAQFERIRYQAEPDALTAILSRTRFRASGFAAMRASKGEWLCQLGYPG